MILNADQIEPNLLGEPRQIDHPLGPLGRRRQEAPEDHIMLHTQIICRADKLSNRRSG
jgi:hypothetical protein